jgi:hypothetical protein
VTEVRVADCAVLHVEAMAIEELSRWVLRERRNLETLSQWDQFLWRGLRIVSIKRVR